MAHRPPLHRFRLRAGHDAGDEFDAASGALGAPGLFQQFDTDKTAPDYGGRPDGAAVDSEGAYWCAMFEGARLADLLAPGAPPAPLPPAGLDDPAGLFNSSLDGNTRRAIDIRQGEAIDANAFKALVRAAVALNTSGRKTRRAK